MKKSIIVIFIIFLIATAWFRMNHTDYLGIKYLEKHHWKYYGENPILGDSPDFILGEFSVNKDTLFYKNTPIAFLVSIELSKLKVKSLDGKQYGIYTNKRFD
jgi:hypothetical protein